MTANMLGSGLDKWHCIALGLPTWILGIKVWIALRYVYRSDVDIC